MKRGGSQEVCEGAKARTPGFCRAAVSSGDGLVVSSSIFGKLLHSNGMIRSCWNSMQFFWDSTSNVGIKNSRFSFLRGRCCTRVPLGLLSIPLNSQCVLCSIPTERRPTVVRPSYASIRVVPHRKPRTQNYNEREPGNIQRGDEKQQQSGVSEASVVMQLISETV